MSRALPGILDNPDIWVAVTLIFCDTGSISDVI
jgi:hypothetical protein